MSLFNDEIKKQLKDILQKLQNKVTIAYFTQEFECDTCKETHEFLDEFVELSDKLELKLYDFKADKEMVEKHHVDMIPAIVLLDKDGKDHGIKFYGLPGGYEINSFISGLLEVSGVEQPVEEALRTRIKNINKDVHIKVFITLSCPHCPGAVSNAHKLALLNDHVVADMVESSTFNTEAIKYNVSAVPKIVINDEHELIGNQPLEKYLEIIDKL